MSSVTEISTAKCFGGSQKVVSHESFIALGSAHEKFDDCPNGPYSHYFGPASGKELQCKMNFAVYIPPQAAREKVPVLYWLSGLTCTEQNFTTKAGCQRIAANFGVLIVAPDTSPRGCNIEDEDDSYDFGTGAGFYLDATQEKWKKNYRMYSYVTKELPSVVNANFPTLEGQMSIFGHSMGGHGALISFLKNPGMYKSVSAFAPICNPVNCPWGEKAFNGYLGSDKELWKEYDSCEVMKIYQGPKPEILIDQGLADNFYTGKQLLPENFKKACDDVQYPLNLRMQEGYDHSYYFISTFLEDHLKHHIKYLKQ